jgi:hypothetical protein
MKRSTFLLLVGISTILFGGSMIIAPSVAVNGNGFAASAQLEYVFRLLGGLLVSIGTLNLLVFNHEDSKTLKAVLIINILNHLVSTGIDVQTISSGLVEIARLVPFLIIHFLIGMGSLIYILKMKSSR